MVLGDTGVVGDNAFLALRCALRACLALLRSSSSRRRCSASTAAAFSALSARLICLDHSLVSVVRFCTAERRLAASAFIILTNLVFSSSALAAA